MTNNNTNVAIKVGNGFTKGQAAETPLANPLLMGPLAGENPGNDPVAGTTTDLGVDGPAPTERGAGAGANTDSVVTEVGGAISGGSCCGPAVLLKG